MKAKVMTRAEHAELGAVLLQYRNDLQARLVAWRNGRRKNHPVTRKWERMLDHLDGLRCLLDDVAAGDLGDDFDVRLYYHNGQTQAAAQSVPGERQGVRASEGGPTPAEAVSERF